MEEMRPVRMGVLLLLVWVFVAVLAVAALVLAVLEVEPVLFPRPEAACPSSWTKSVPSKCRTVSPSLQLPMLPRRSD